MNPDHERRTDDGHPGPSAIDAAATVDTATDQVQVDDALQVRGEQFPPSETFALCFETVDGTWDLAGQNRVVGASFESRIDRLDDVRTTERGAFETAVTVPETIGGPRTLSLRSANDDVLAETEVTVVPRFELDRTRVPLGGTFTLSCYGLAPADLRNNYRVVWDSGAVGFVTGLGNRGTATAEVRAVGPPGKHTLRVGPISRHGSFLRTVEQSRLESVVDAGRACWTVDVAEPRAAPPAAWVDDLPAEEPIHEHYPAIGDPSGADLTVTPRYGRAGTEITIEGSGFPAGEEVRLVWHRHQGQRMQGVPITPEPTPGVLPDVTPDSDGRFRTSAVVPQDLGGTRPITAEVGDEPIAVDGFVLQPDVLDISPTRGPVGTEIEVELTGVGWTEFDNSLHFVYDNRPLGYVCGGAGREGVENPGTATTVLRATGGPGYHFLDVYPNVFGLEDDEPAFVNVPNLSHRETHPGRSLPSLHFSFEITG